MTNKFMDTLRIITTTLVCLSWYAIVFLILVTNTSASVIMTMTIVSVVLTIVALKLIYLSTKEYDTTTVDVVTIRTVREEIDEQKKRKQAMNNIIAKAFNNLDNSVG